MEVELKVGAKLDLLNAAEAEGAMRNALASWSREIGRGVKFRTASGRSNAAAGAFTIDGSQVQDIGPEPGMVWSVMRAVIVGNGVVAGTDLWSLYQGDANPSKLIDSRLTAGIMRQFNVGAVVLTSGDNLVATGAATGAGVDVTLSLGVIELPYQLAWQLL
jgi:hypothetical protein